MANLMEIYEYYLLAMFLLGGVQLYNYAGMFRMVLATPRRWPKLYGSLKENLHTVLTLPTLTVITFMFGAWLLHTFLRRMVWPDATVTVAELFAETGPLALAFVFGVTMVTLDIRAILRAARFQPPGGTWIIDLTELGLRSEVPPLQWLLRWRLRAKLAAKMPMVRRWLWKRSAEIGARVGFGSTLWLVWVVRGGLG